MIQNFSRFLETDLSILDLSEPYEIYNNVVILFIYNFMYFPIFGQIEPKIGKLFNFINYTFFNTNLIQT